MKAVIETLKLVRVFNKLLMAVVKRERAHVTADLEGTIEKFVATFQDKGRAYAVAEVTKFLNSACDRQWQ